MKKLLFLFFIFSFYLSNTEAQPDFEFSPLALEAFEKVNSFRFEEARRLLTQIKRDDPKNYIVYHIENYIDFYTIYINEEKKEFDQLERNKDIRLKMIRKGNPDSPYFLFIQASIRLQWAMTRLKFEEYVTAFLEINKAYKLLEKSQKQFPDFMPAKKDLSILHAMVGTIPDNYKWGVKFLTGMEGTISQGKKEMEEVISFARNNDFIYETEALTLYSYILMILDKKGEEAWESLKSANLNPKSSLLACFTLANAAMGTNRNEEAIKILENRPRGSAYQPFPYLDFLLGKAKLQRLDKDAEKSFLRFIKNFKGQNYVKEAHQKLGWCALLNNDKQGYFFQMKQCKEKGNTLFGSDQSAMIEADAERSPDLTLLKARLLFDGGYFDRALDLLNTRKAADYSDKYFRLEYSYRKGRVLHGLDREQEAIRFYQLAIEEGKDEPYYFAANAALKAGQIYEGNRNIPKAKKYYNLCLDMKPHEFRTSLHQQAKAGLMRVQK
ncbi:MAG: hypothetical protein GY705_06805 [Bacteroidetes bacterium]|nr:hypothetical protein [Bacteroidota bacterium]